MGNDYLEQLDRLMILVTDEMLMQASPDQIRRVIQACDILEMQAKRVRLFKEITEIKQKQLDAFDPLKALENDAFFGALVEDVTRTRP